MKQNIIKKSLILREEEHSQENDLLIIKFMDYINPVVNFPDREYKLPHPIIPYAGFEQYSEDVEIKFRSDFGLWDTQFHISWDWLMPVVKKCYELSPGISLSTNIKEQYSVVVSFIKSRMK